MQIFDTQSLVFNIIVTANSSKHGFKNDNIKEETNKNTTLIKQNNENESQELIVKNNNEYFLNKEKGKLMIDEEIKSGKINSKTYTQI